MVPLGSTCTTALRCICTSTPLAICTPSALSDTETIRPSMPPAVTTSSPLARASIMARCSFCFFICGRIMMKYSTTNISTSGSMLVRVDDIEADSAAAGAAWA